MMEINASYLASALAAGNSSSAEAQDVKKKVQEGEISGESISNAYLINYTAETLNYSSQTLTTQSAVFDFSKIADMLDALDTESIGYTGTPISQLSSDEASALVSEDGYFGILQTSSRMADFVLNGGGDDLNRLKAGREGMLKGFDEAEQMWGGKLPDIAYETLTKALEKVDEKIASLGGNVLDTSA